jgi:hypothetical protein
MQWIYATLRFFDQNVVYNAMLDAINLRKKYGKYVVGFDLMDEEDRYNRLIYYIDSLLSIKKYIKDNNLPGKFSFNINLMY